MFAFSKRKVTETSNEKVAIFMSITVFLENREDREKIRTNVLKYTSIYNCSIM